MPDGTGQTGAAAVGDRRADPDHPDAVGSPGGKGAGAVGPVAVFTDISGLDHRRTGIAVEPDGLYCNPGAQRGAGRLVSVPGLHHPALAGRPAIMMPDLLH